MSLSEVEKDRLESAISDIFARLGLVSDWVLAVEVVSDDSGARTLASCCSPNAPGWKAHGMALYLAAAHAPQPGYHP